ncbi:hypothetical protein CXB51_028049 [Gossypium anomalum]|uniref:RNase H type-1 domain-containing protein n=1 Tax=Gossypium anomalum TaxID=47600 RepID=A0A8J6CPC3_9ROSI|nr:hypothetical protein CXB51_028049 [Gossypium anomalum]
MLVPNLTLRSLFDERLKQILAILLSSSAHHDEMVWQWDNKCVYSAKSGYKWLLADDSTSSTQWTTCSVSAPLLGKSCMGWTQIFPPPAVNVIGKHGQNAFGIIAFIKAYITKNDNLEEVSTTKQTPVDRKWEPPIGAVMKLNFDAAFHQHTNISIFGIIARNTEGQIMAACTHLNKYVMDSTVAEAPACLQSLIFTEDLGFQRIMVEGDTLTAMKKKGISGR